MADEEAPDDDANKEDEPPFDADNDAVEPAMFMPIDIELSKLEVVKFLISLRSSALKSSLSTKCFLSLVSSGSIFFLNDARNSFRLFICS